MMTITWTETFTTQFDIDQAVEDAEFDFANNSFLEQDDIIYSAVENNMEFHNCEVLDYYEAIEIAAKALRTRLGGVQMRMELD